jgi:superfamily I DNA/RNA helicase/Zn-dependent peptidase ImmA (M78 family)
VDALARLLGLDVATFDPALHPGVWGYLEPGENLIFVRAGLTPAVARFTLAHEIGHAVLHRRGGADLIVRESDATFAQPASAEDWATCAGDDVEAFDIGVDESLQPGQIYNARSAPEREANAFAVALLMPQEPFLADYLDLYTNANLAQGNVTRLLARRFGVSEDAALRRLQSLLAPEAIDTPTAPATSRYSIDEDQRRAARLEAPALVVAGPGAGKTSTLIARMSYLALEQGVDPANTLILTFSRKSAAELQVRAQFALGVAARNAAPYVSTIHHFCLELLGRYGQFVGLSSTARLAPEIERYLALRDVIREAPLNGLAPTYAPDLYVRDVLQAISRAKDDLLTPAEALAKAEREKVAAIDEEAADRQAEFALVYERYQQRMSAQQVIDFGDIIALTARLLHERPDVAQEVVAQWPHMLVDEYQDINHAMDVLIRELVSAGARLWAVGDADQAIYRFRGADPGVVYRFQETYPGAQTINLVRNYRSRQGILDAASAFASQFSLVESRPALASVRAGADEAANASPAVRLAVAATDLDELAGLARHIRARRQAGVAYADQVALLRTRRQVERIALGLRAHGVPTTMLSNAFEDENVKRLLAILSLLSEPAGLGLIRAARQPDHAFPRADAITLIHEARARKRPVVDLLTPARLDGLPGLSHEGRHALRRLGRMLQRMRAAPNVATGIALYCFSFTEIGAQALAARASDDAPAALRRLLDLARAFDSWQAETYAKASTGANWREFAEYVRAAAALRLDGLDDRAGAGESSVRVMTVHASKGLEFPVVYTPQLVNRRFPLTGGGASATLWNQRDDLQNGGELSEEAALFYVAMTRAQNELILSYARKYGKAAYTVSPFLGPIEAALNTALTREEWHDVEAQGTAAVSQELPDANAGDDAQPRSVATPFDVNELETYQRCPRQYAYRYVDSLWTPPSLGTLYSSVLRQVSNEITAALVGSHAPDTPALTYAAALALFEERWRAALSRNSAANTDAEAPTDRALSGFYLRQGLRVMERLWLRLSHESESNVGAPARPTRSQALTVNLGSLAIRGEVEMLDEVEDGGDGAVALRYRSATATPTIRDLFIESAAESYGAASESGKAVAVNPTTGVRAALRLSARQRARLLREAETAANGIAQRDFHAIPDERVCQRCPFAASCPE